MFTQRHVAVRVAHLCWVIGAVAIPAPPTRADSISEAPIAEGLTSLGEIYSGPPAPYLDMLGNPGFVAAVKFDITAISTIPQGAMIDSATLNLTVASAQSRFESTSTEGVSGYGDSSGVMGQNDFYAPRTFIGDSQPLPNTTTLTSIPITFDVTSFVQSLVSARTNYAGFILDIDSLSGGGISDYSTVTPYPAYFPNLSITFSAVPEPPSALLACLGLAGLAAAARLRGPRIAA